MQSKVADPILVLPINIASQQRHDGHDGVSNHQPYDCILNRSGADERKRQSSVSLLFVRGVHRWPVNYPHKGPVMRKMFPFDDVITGFDIHWRWMFFIYSYLELEA